MTSRKKRTTEDVIKEIKEVHGDKYIIPKDFKFNGTKGKLHIICPIHGDFFPFYHNFIIKGCGCRKCKYKIYTNEEFTNDIKKIYGNKFSYEFVEFKGYRNKIKLICNNCGKEILASPKSLLKGCVHCDCEKEHDTLLEQEMKDYLEKENIDFIEKYQADWLKLKQKMHLDFYIPSMNLAIECQGRFHFQPYSKDDDKSIKEFEKQCERDKFKYELCKKHGIEIIYFTHLKYKEKYIGIIINKIEDIINHGK